MMKESSHYKIRLSVIVPVYNAAEWLGECIDSLLVQRLPFYEIILVDDGSMDDSLRICREYEGTHEAVSVIEIKHSMQGAARNAGIKASSGDYILFVDADDLLVRHATERIADTLLSTASDILYFSGRSFGIESMIDDMPSYLRHLDISPDSVISGRSFFEIAYPDSYYSSACVAVYRSDYIKSGKRLFPEGVLYEDNLFTFRATMESGRVACIRDELYRRRVRRGSVMTGAYTISKYMNYCSVMDGIYDIINDLLLEENSDKLVWYGIDLCAGIASMYEKHIKDRMILNTQEREYVTDLIRRYCSMLRNALSHAKPLFLQTLYWSLLRIIKKTKLPDFEADEDLLRQKDIMRPMYLELLRSIPFNDTDSILVYGVGKHTQGLMHCYRSLIGEIKADITFAQTIINGEEMFEGKPVYGIEEIDPERFGCVIVSSALYEKEMLRKLDEKGMTRNRVCFYKNGETDLFSGMTDVEW